MADESRSPLHPHRRRPQARDLPARRAPAALGRRAPPLHAADPARERAPERRRATDVEAVAGWVATDEPSREISFAPARVLLQDFTGVPAVVDLAAMRNAMADLGGDPEQINPLIPAELVIDHSVQVDVFGTRERLRAQRRARVRAQPRALRLPALGPEGASATSRSCRPAPGSSTRSTSSTSRAWSRSATASAFPDTLVGTDSHTTMVNGLGVLGWGVGGIEAEAAMLGEPLSMLVPQVVGFKLTGRLPEGATATDLVLTVTEILRQAGVVGKFVEYFGHGLGLAAARRPRDDREHVARVRRDVRLLPGRRADARLPAPDRPQRRADRARRGLLQGEHALARPERGADVLAGGRARPLDRRAVARRPAPPAGPRPAHAREDRVPRRRSARSASRTRSRTAATTRPSPTPSRRATRRPSRRRAAPPSPSRTRRRSRWSARAGRASASPGTDYELEHGCVVIAAITSCTNTSNPQVMVGAGLLAKKAVERGLHEQALGEVEPRARARRS